MEYQLKIVSLFHPIFGYVYRNEWATIWIWRVAQINATKAVQVELVRRLILGKSAGSSWQFKLTSDANESARNVRCGG